MKKCSRCGKEYGDEMTFCAECGEKLEEAQVKFCRNCGEKIEPDALVCPKCGAELQKKSEEKKKNNVFKKIAIACTTVAVAVVVVMGGVVIKTKTHSEAVEAYYYQKDKDWYYYNANTREHGQAGYNNSGRYEYGSESAPILSEDGTKVFYTEDKTLLYRNLKGKDNKEVLIDTNIVEYAINENGSEVIYLKKDGSLYKNKLKKNEKKQLVDVNSILCFVASDDLNKVLTIQQSEDEDTALCSVYDVKNNEQGELEGSFEGSPYEWNSDLSEIRFFGNSGYYLFDNGEIRKTNIMQTIKYDSGEMYYIKVEDTTLMELVEDDVDDKSLQAKLRQDLEYYQLALYSIYYSDGKKEKLVAKSFAVNNNWYGFLDLPLMATAHNEPAIVIKTGSIDKLVKMSEIENIDDVFYLIGDTLKVTWIVKDTIKDTLLDCESQVVISDDGNNIVYKSEKGDYLLSKDKKVLLDGVSDDFYYDCCVTT